MKNRCDAKLARIRKVLSSRTPDVLAIAEIKSIVRQARKPPGMKRRVRY